MQRPSGSLLPTIFWEKNYIPPFWFPIPLESRKDERRALKELQSDTSIVILPANKGRYTVILNREDYSEKCKPLPPYFFGLKFFL